MSRKSLCCIILILSNSAQATTYSIQKGDTLSHIAQRTYPNEKVYGKNGSLQKLIELNSIANSDLIFVGQKILIKQVSPITGIIPHEITPKVLEHAKSSLMQKDEWKIGLNYGVKYFSYNQSRDLEKAEVSVILPETYHFYSQYRFENFEFQFNFERYKLEYESSGSSGSEDLNEFNLKANYKNFVLGVSIIDTPIFKKETGVVSMAKLTIKNLVLGYQMLWKLPVKKETLLELNPTFYYPVSISSDDTDIKPSKPEGYMGEVEIKLSRIIKEADNYKIRAVWPVNTRYDSLSYDVEWGASKGSNDTNIWSIGTQVGFEINF